MLRIAICDDNITFAEKISKIIQGYFFNNSLEIELFTFCSGADLMNAYQIGRFDVIFLDIEMPVVSGFDVANIIRQSFDDCIIVFVTAHDEFVYDSMNYQPFNFVRKTCGTPLEKSIFSVLNKIAFRLKINQQILIDDCEMGKISVKIYDIIYLQSQKHYVKYYVANREQPFRVRANISDCEKMYAEYDFIRIHKQYIVNLLYLAAVDNKLDEILLSVNKKRLAMSRNFKSKVNEQFVCFLRRGK